jgi:hypothetical protein
VPRTLHIKIFYRVPGWVRFQQEGLIFVWYVSLPGLNHLFQHCTTGLPSEYSSIEETFAPEVLKLIDEWILAL